MERCQFGMPRGERGRRGTNNRHLPAGAGFAATSAMTCQEVVFASATCQIEIVERTSNPDIPQFVARLWVIDRERRARHPLVDADGRDIELHGPTEALALSTAVTFLAGPFGALSEYAHGCADLGTREGRTALIIG
jgi:hypothetical protein